MRYEVYLERTVTSTTVIEVTAANEDEAELKAEKLANEDSTEWGIESDMIQVNSVDEVELA